jgi:hypothetical protein
MACRSPTACSVQSRRNNPPSTPRETSHRSRTQRRTCTPKDRPPILSAVPALRRLSGTWHGSAAHWSLARRTRLRQRPLRSDRSPSTGGFASARSDSGRRLSIRQLCVRTSVQLITVTSPTLTTESSFVTPIDRQSPDTPDMPSSLAPTSLASPTPQRTGTVGRMLGSRRDVTGSSSTPL